MFPPTCHQYPAGYIRERLLKAARNVAKSHSRAGRLQIQKVKVRTRSFLKRPILSCARFPCDVYANFFPSAYLAMGKEFCCCDDNRTVIERV